MFESQNQLNTKTQCKTRGKCGFHIKAGLFYLRKIQLISLDSGKKHLLLT
mgnify:CR=1 FL=1